MKTAIELLLTIGALNPDESLTTLGSQLVDLPIEPRLGKSVLAAITLR